VTADQTPTRTSSDPDPDAQGGQPDARPSLTALIALGAIGVALLWFAFLFLRFREGVTVDGILIYTFDDAWAFDLDAYVHAAQRLVADGSLYARELVAAPFEPGDPDLFYYAPPLGVAMLPIADIVVHDSSVLWYVLRIALLLGACLLMPVKPLTRALAFLAVSFTLWAMKDAILGNVSILLVLPLVLGWRYMDRPLGSIALAAAMSVRPGLGLILLWQVLRRQWRAAAWTIGAGIVLILLTLPVVGIDGYRDYFTVVGNLSVPTDISENRDFGATVLSLGGTEAAVTLARLLSVVVGVGVVVLGLRKDREIGYMLALCGSLLIVPLLWELYLLTLIVPLALLAERTRPAILLLTLVSWLPALLTPLMLLGVVLLLFLAPGPRQTGGKSEPQPDRALEPAGT
jgi:hypothetical protein